MFNYYGVYYSYSLILGSFMYLFVIETIFVLKKQEIL